MDKEELQKLIDSTDMVALVSPYTKLVKAGANYKGLCPFHKEDTPSFMVNQEKKMAHCFGCGKGGNPIQFLMDIKHIDFKAAVMELAAINKFKLSRGFNSNPVDKLYAKYYEINKFALEVYERYLYNSVSGKKALEYLYNRGLDDETIKKFHIGLAPSEGQVLYKILKDQNYLELDLVELNLIRQFGNSYKDVFTNRIMFPILDERGRVVAFSGRIMDNNKNEPKYINTTDTKIFKKNMVLYNLNNAVNGINVNKRVIIYEGFMDVIASCRSGLEEAVCSMGTALTINQIKLLKNYINNVVLSFDTDNAGILATQRATTLFNNEGFNVKYLLLDKYKDVDEYVKNLGEKAYNDFFNNNLIDYYNYMYLIYTKDIDTSNISLLEERKNKIFELIYTSHSEIIIHEYINRFSKLIDLEYESLRKEYDIKYPSYNNGYPNINNNYPPIEDYPPQQGFLPIDGDVPYNYQEQTPIVTINKYNSNIILSEARLLNYATINSRYAKRIDDYINDNNIRFSNDENVSLIWLTLYSEYYKKYDEYNEDLFIKMLEDKDRLSNGSTKCVIKFKEILDFLRNNTLSFPYNEEDLMNNLNDKKRRKYLRNKFNNKNTNNLSSEQIKRLLENNLKDVKKYKGGSHELK